MNIEPTSRLTCERPDIWTRGLALATAHTGLVYLPKVPTPEGIIYACGGRIVQIESPEDWDKEERDREQQKRQDERLRKKRERGAPTPAGAPRAPEKDTPPMEERQRITDDVVGELIKRRAPEPPREESAPEVEAPGRVDPYKGFYMAPVFVPDGAMEWLLHEMGHYVAATPEERLRPHYGIGQSLWGRDAEQEWQAWAFEEIILAPWGHARHFAPPSQQDGVGYSKAGPIEAGYLDHAERQIRALGIDVEQWRALYGEWIRWERRRSSAFGSS